MKNKILFEDITESRKSYGSLYESLAGKRILITGATGLIGFNLVQFLLKDTGDGIQKPQVTVLVRNREKAERLFEGLECLSILEGSIRDKILITEKQDYIIHGASITDSKAFVETPVDVIDTAYASTKNLLDYAVETGAESFIYLSSMEVYGAPEREDRIFENSSNNIDTMKVRGSYPESKRICESLCCSYYHQNDVSAKVIRLTQTFGTGVDESDTRVFAEFARSVRDGKDIILKTKGETKRQYLYTADAVSAILTVMLKGENGEAYNAANEGSFCSIYEMAHVFADASGGKTGVVIKEEDPVRSGFAPLLKMNLATDKLQSLGWSPRYKMAEMVERLCRSFSELS